jgi:hypothetical protein
MRVSKLVVEPHAPTVHLVLPPSLLFFDFALQVVLGVTQSFDDPFHVRRHVTSPSHTLEIPKVRGAQAFCQLQPHGSLLKGQEAFPEVLSITRALIDSAADGST